MATYTLTAHGYHIQNPSSRIWDVIGQSTADISNLFDILDYLYTSGQIEGGEICSDLTGEVIGYAKNGKIVVVK